MREAEKQTARLAKDVAEQLAAEADRRRIDDRHHLFDVAGQQRIEQGFVGILQTAQEDVALDVAAERAKSIEPALDLVVEFRDMRRQKAVQVERVAFVFGEGGALVEQRIVEQFVAAQRRRDVLRSFSAHRSRHPTGQDDTCEPDCSIGLLRQRCHRAGLATAAACGSDAAKLDAFGFGAERGENHDDDRDRAGDSGKRNGVICRRNGRRCRPAASR